MTTLLRVDDEPLDTDLAARVIEDIPDNARRYPPRGPYSVRRARVVGPRAAETDGGALRIAERTDLPTLFTLDRPATST